MPVGLLTTKHHYTTMENNTAADARAIRSDSSVRHRDDLCSGVPVTTHAEDSFCDSKPDKHCALAYMSEKNVDELARLDPLNRVKDYVAELMEQPLQRRLKDTHRNNTQRIYLIYLFSTVLSRWDFSHGKFELLFPGESQLRQGLATQPTVHAGYFSVPIIHRTLTLTTGSLTCAQGVVRAP